MKKYIIEIMADGIDGWQFMGVFPAHSAVEAISKFLSYAADHKAITAVRATEFKP